MKKRIVTLLCAVMLCALLQPAVLAASDSIELDFNGQHLTLMFDRSEQFSNVSGGTVQASFYTYLDGSNDLYELYMIFPKDMQAGTTVDPAYARQHAADTAVMLIVTTKAEVGYYCAGQADATDATDYARTFATVSDTDAGSTYSGTLSASLIGMAGDSDTELTPVSIQNARFSFTMPMQGTGAPEEFPEDSAPPADADPFAEENPFADPTPAPTREVYRV